MNIFLPSNSDEIDLQQEQKEIEELARECVKFMNGELKMDEYEFFSLKMPNIAQQKFNAPVSVKRVKEIEI